jgi:hypothetical protein
MKEKKDHLIAFRVTDSEKTKLNSITKELNTNITEVMRGFVLLVTKENSLNKKLLKKVLK